MCTQRSAFSVLWGKLLHIACSGLLLHLSVPSPRLTTTGFRAVSCSSPHLASIFAYFLLLPANCTKSKYDYMPVLHVLLVSADLRRVEQVLIWAMMLIKWLKLSLFIYFRTTVVIFVHLWNLYLTFWHWVLSEYISISFVCPWLHIECLWFCDEGFWLCVHNL